MRLDPDLKLANLLTAIPSASNVGDTFHVQICGSEPKRPAQLCDEPGITFDSFLRALHELDWEDE